jgi:hypothetical protein
MTRRLVLVSLLAIASLAIVTPVSAHAQAGAKSRLGPDGAPIWDRLFRLPDGRTFVTDGAITLDAALARPKALPNTELPESTGKVLEKYLSASLEHEFSVDRLATGRFPRSYVTPNGVTLSADYVDYLARTLGRGQVRLRVGGELQPMVIVVDGKAVGLVMALKG